MLRFLLLLFSLGGWPCVPVQAAEGKFTIVTSFTILADMARNVAGDAAAVHSITRAGAEIHDYQPTPQDIMRAQAADLILWNGLNLERWYERFTQDLEGVPSVTLSDGVAPLPIRAGGYKDKPNPHAWMSPGAAKIYVENIRKALSQHDPAHAEIYARNAARYSAQIDAVAQEITQRLAHVPSAQRWLVTSEGAFSYLARDLGFQELYLWPINAEQQGTPQQIRAALETVRAHNIPVVFSESTISDKPARQLAQESGARYGGTLYVDSLSAANGPVPTYLDLLRVTTRTIADGFAAAAKEPHAE